MAGENQRLASQREVYGKDKSNFRRSESYYNQKGYIVKFFKNCWLLLVFALFFSVAPVSAEVNENANKRLKLIKEAYLKMQHFYYKDFDLMKVANLFYRSHVIMVQILAEAETDYEKKLDRLAYSTIATIVDALKDESDDYSKFIHKDYLTRTVRENLVSKFAGIGIEVKKEDDTFLVAKVYKDSSAFEKGIKKGDRLLEIDNESVVGLDLKEIEKKLKRDNGKTVLLKLEGSESLSYIVELVCRIIWVPSVKGRYYPDNKAAYIKIDSFRNDTYAEFVTEYNKLQEYELIGLIIDLRGNGGGDETQVIKLCASFLPEESLVVYFMKKDVGRREEKTKQVPLKIDLPTVILVDKNSKSSSEMFSGAMQYHEKATVIGQQTAGMGSLKNTIALSDGSALFLVTSRTFLPNGVTYDQVGIKPDILLEDTEMQMTKALELISEGVKQ